MSLILQAFETIFMGNFELLRPRQETKKVLVWVSEKVELEKWVIGIEFELWDLSNELWVIEDAQSKQVISLLH